MTPDSRRKTQAAVDALRTEIATCDLAMIVDSETGLVLCAASAMALPQDDLDSIADDARVDMHAPWVDAMPTADRLVSVARTDGTGHTIVLRAPNGEEIVVCRTITVPDWAVLDDAVKMVLEALTTAGGS